MNIQEINKENSDALIEYENISLSQKMKLIKSIPGLDSAITDVKKKRSAEFLLGFDFICANIGEFGMGTLELIAYPNDEEILSGHLDTREIGREMLGYDESDYLVVYYIICDDFIQGMKEASKIVLEESKKSTHELINEMISEDQLDRPDGLESVLRDDEQ